MLALLLLHCSTFLANGASEQGTVAHSPSSMLLPGQLCWCACWPPAVKVVNLNDKATEHVLCHESILLKKANTRICGYRVTCTHFDPEACIQLPGVFQSFGLLLGPLWFCMCICCCDFQDEQETEHQHRQQLFRHR